MSVQLNYQRYIPEVYLPSTTKEVGFGFQNGLTIISYLSCKYKCVILLIITTHDDEKVDIDFFKLEII